MQTATNNTVISVESLSKRFRHLRIPKRMTLKEALIKRNLFAGPNSQRYIQALSDVSFEVSKGSTIGIVGPNGSGKSTLVKLIAGVMKPDAGRVMISGNIAPLLSLGVGFHPDLTGRENAKINGLILGLSPDDVEQRMEQIAAFAELDDFMDSPVHTYSTGMYMRLAFSVGVNVDPDILLLDEIFAVGDAAFASKCRDQMKRFKELGKTIVFVSHDLETIELFCDRALWLDHGVLRKLGDAKDVVETYRAHVQSSI
ncbi:MAG: ABC transporter ATP-binding protein [Candidatus Eremiobacteraeota bacterium]|nr:ABC transporter ATP-binding protein [Candidatus Eremiobacteraeota bacterium]